MRSPDHQTVASADIGFELMVLIRMTANGGLPAELEALRSSAPLTEPLRAPEAPKSSPPVGMLGRLAAWVNKRFPLSDEFPITGERVTGVDATFAAASRCAFDQKLLGDMTVLKRLRAVAPKAVEPAMQNPGSVLSDYVARRGTNVPGVTEADVSLPELVQWMRSELAAASLASDPGRLDATGLAISDDLRKELATFVNTTAAGTTVLLGMWLDDADKRESSIANARSTGVDVGQARETRQPKPQTFEF